MGKHCTHASVVDIKGREWIRIVPFIEDKHQCRIIDMDQGIFVNTMRLDDLQINSAYAEEFFNAAVSDTVRFFKIVVNMQENEGNERDLEDILYQAVMKMYYNREDEYVLGRCCYGKRSKEEIYLAYLVTDSRCGLWSWIFLG